MAQWSTLMPCNREAAGSNLSGFCFYLKGAHYEVDYSGKKTHLAGLQCTFTSSCAKGNDEIPRVAEIKTSKKTFNRPIIKLRKLPLAESIVDRTPSGP